MIELPRAAMTAHEIANEAEFFSFGTNDMTQTTWGFSRDDVEAAFFPQYIEAGIFDVSPFETLDVEGVGRIVSVAAWEGKETRPDLVLGVCGEHGGDPASIHFFESILLDYVSCSPFRVPVARLEAGRAHARDPRSPPPPDPPNCGKAALSCGRLRRAGLPAIARGAGVSGGDEAGDAEAQAAGVDVAAVRRRRHVAGRRSRCACCRARPSRWAVAPVEGAEVAADVEPVAAVAVRRPGSPASTQAALHRGARVAATSDRCRRSSPRGRRAGSRRSRGLLGRGAVAVDRDDGVGVHPVALASADVDARTPVVVRVRVPRHDTTRAPRAGQLRRSARPPAR